MHLNHNVSKNICRNKFIYMYPYILSQREQNVTLAFKVLGQIHWKCPLKLQYLGNS